METAVVEVLRAGAAGREFRRGDRMWIVEAAGEGFHAVKVVRNVAGVEDGR